MLVNKYRKRPIVIEAIQWDGNNFDKINDFTGGNKIHKVESWDKEVNNSIVIPTLEGDHRANVGDYIIQGIEGEFYPCKPGIFIDTYERVEDAK